MARFGVDQLIQNIINAIYTNTSNDIEGDDVQEQLIDTVDSLSQLSYDNTIPYKVGQGIILMIQVRLEYIYV